MSKNTNQEKFKTMIGGQALVEGIMMRGPKTDAIVVRTADGISVETKPRKIRPKGSIGTWPLIRGAVGFFDAQVTGVKALMRSADLSPEGGEEPSSKFDQWLEKKLGQKKFQNFLIGTAVAFGLGMSILLFFLLPGLIVSLFDHFVDNMLVKNLIEGLIRILIFLIYMIAVSCMKDMRRVFAYHGAEHKTIRCYEAGLPLTVENVRQQSCKHPRCGTSFLFVVMILSILVFSAASSLLLWAVPQLAELDGTIAYKAIMIGFKLLMIPVVVAFAYEINRLVGRYDNWFTRLMTWPGMLFQNFTTNEPDDSMIEVGIASLEAVLPEEAGTDLW